MSGLYQNFVKNIVYPLETIRIGSSARRHLAELERSQFFSPEKIKELQVERLRRLLIHAYENCPFYTDRFNQCGFNPRKLQTIEDMQIIPVTTKKDIQDNNERMRAVNYSDDQLEPNKTGGSTGSPLFFYHDMDRIYSREASTFRHNRWAGWDIGMKTAYLWGHRGDLSGVQNVKARLRNLLLERRLILDTSSISREKLTAFNQALNKYRPEIYIAYANSIFLFARFLKETGIRDYHRPRAVITSAEVLEPSQRQVIESVFECRVFDRYGSRETSLIASECDRHSGLHLCAETLLLEFVREGKPTSPGQPGKTLVTDLLNFGMPFIRYQNEDTGCWTGNNCGCGRGLPLMSIAGGRITDFLITPEGQIISGAALTIYLIANAPGVAQAQLIQENINEVTFRIVKGEKFGDATLRFFEREIPRFFGPRVKYSIEYVENIPLESSGKYRFSISKVDPSEMF
ncbi:putative CapK related-protein [Candidatus Zixiibacteriota bacterium]|nr:putative CapK related-protein [candidate division Zixibacteria bacterium]